MGLSAKINSICWLKDSQSTTNRFSVTGKVVGYWYFEVKSRMNIYANEGIPLGDNYMRTQGEFMTYSFVDFKGDIHPFLTH